SHSDYGVRRAIQEPLESRITELRLRKGRRCRSTLGGAALLFTLLVASSPADADREAIRLAAEHLMRSQPSSGLLRYDFDFVAGIPVASDDIVRQSGVFAFMAAYYADTHDPRMRPALESALLAFRRLSVPIAKDGLRCCSSTLACYRLRLAASGYGECLTVCACSIGHTRTGVSSRWT